MTGLSLVKAILMHYSEDTKYLVDGYRSAFTDGFFRGHKTTRVNFMACTSPKRHYDKTAWGTKLLLIAVLPYPVNCASLCYIMKAQHCLFCLNSCLWLPIPSHPPTSIDTIHDIAGVKNLSQKSGT